MTSSSAVSVATCIVGGAGNDMVDGDAGRRHRLRRRRWSSPGRLATGRTAGSRRLCGTLLYSRSDSTTAANLCNGAPVPTENNSGVLLVDGIAQPYRDPDGAPWWAEYDVTNLCHDVRLRPRDRSGPASFGNDYLAGGAANDLIFGQLGNDVIQGDGGIDTAYKRWSTTDHDRSGHRSRPPLPRRREPDAARLRRPGRCDGLRLHRRARRWSPSLEAATDGEDYIEGNAGNDVVFGEPRPGRHRRRLERLLQPHHARQAARRPAVPDARVPARRRPRRRHPVRRLGHAHRHQRPDPRRRRHGRRTRRHPRRRPDATTAPRTWTRATPTRSSATTATSSASSASAAHDVNGDTNKGGIGAAPTTGAELRDLQLRHLQRRRRRASRSPPGDQRLVVRGVNLLDYTVGGPDYQPENFGHGRRQPTATARRRSRPAPTCSTRRTGAWKTAQIGGRDEVHGETGDDTVYGGADHDVIYGDAQNDDLIGGWGNDWISGGTGADGILGDDGRIFTSRNTGVPGCRVVGASAHAARPSRCTASSRCARPTRTPKNTQGDVLNEFIYTPGQVQTATINVANELVKAVDLTLYNLGPDTNTSLNKVVNAPTYDANNSDDIIFGGWGSTGSTAAPATTRSPAPRRSASTPTALGAAGRDIGLHPALRQLHRQPGRPRVHRLRPPVEPGRHPPLRRRHQPVALEPPQRRRASASSSSTTSTTRAARSSSTRPAQTWGCTGYTPSGHTCTAQPRPRAVPEPVLPQQRRPDGNYVPAPGACIAVDNQGNCTADEARSAHRRQRRDLRRPRQRLARRRHRPGHAVGRLGQRPQQRRRRPALRMPQPTRTNGTCTQTGDTLPERHPGRRQLELPGPRLRRRRARHPDRATRAATA